MRSIKIKLLLSTKTLSVPDFNENTQNRQKSFITLLKSFKIIVHFKGSDPSVGYYRLDYQFCYTHRQQWHWFHRRNNNFHQNNNTTLKLLNYSFSPCLFIYVLSTPFPKSALFKLLCLYHLHICHTQSEPFNQHFSSLFFNYIHLVWIPGAKSNAFVICTRFSYLLMVLTILMILM